jgi:4-coumarate--CoA ligase
VVRIITGPYPDIDVPDGPLTAYVLRHAARLADCPALVDGSTGRTLTYGDLEQRVRRLAGGLASRGFGKGDVLALLAPNMPEYAVVFHGVAMAGGTVSTINPAYTRHEIREQLANSKARFVVTVPATHDALAEARREVSVEEVFVLDPDTGACSLYAEPISDQVAVDPADDVVALPYSSGTTGYPKGVMLTHRNLLANLEQTRPLDLKEGQSVVAALPMFHIYGMQILMNYPLSAGGTVVTLARFDLETFLRLHQEHRPPRAYVVPPILLALARHPLVDEYDLSGIEEIFCAAAPLAPDLAAETEARLGCRVVQGYGLTETSPATHLAPPDGPPRGSVGVVVASTECRIVDPNSGDDVSPGKHGEIWVRGPQVMKGYLDSEAATRETIDDQGWLHTGDIGHADDNGNFFIVDRLKELIKYKGFQIAPAELEAVLLTQPDVADAAVIPVPDDEAGEIPKAFVVLNAGSTAGAEQIMEHVASRVATFKRIRVVEFIDAIPKSPSGKILRRLLRERAMGA